VYGAGGEEKSRSLRVRQDTTIISFSSGLDACFFFLSHIFGGIRHFFNLPLNRSSCYTVTDNTTSVGRKKERKKRHF
jgi:hypothetical protein